jgi:hypothetical protein
MSWAFQPLLPGAAQQQSGAAGTAGYIKVWTGSVWVAKPVKVWDGTQWVIKPVKFWNGSAWQTTTGL